MINRLVNRDVWRDFSLLGSLNRSFAFKEILYHACAVKPIPIAKIDRVQHFFHAVQVDHRKDDLELIPCIPLFLHIQPVDVLVSPMSELFLELLLDPVDGTFRVTLVRPILDEKPLALGDRVLSDRIRCRCIYPQDRPLDLKANLFLMRVCPDRNGVSVAIVQNGVILSDGAHDISAVSVLDDRYRKKMLSFLGEHLCGDPPCCAVYLGVGCSLKPCDGKRVQRAVVVWIVIFKRSPSCDYYLLLCISITQECFFVFSSYVIPTNKISFSYFLNIVG